MAVLVVCGESATPVPTNTPEPPAATPAPTEATTEVMEWEVSDELKAYAAENAGGPGAI